MGEVTFSAFIGDVQSCSGLKLVRVFIDFEAVQSRLLEKVLFFGGNIRLHTLSIYLL